MGTTHQGVIDWAEETEEPLITFDGLDGAIVGITQVHTQVSRVAYSFDKIMEILVDDGETSYEDALDYFEFNIACLWAGEYTPAILYDLD